MSARKDHLLQHLRNKHKKIVSSPSVTTPCLDGGTLIFSSAWCLKQYMVERQRITTESFSQKERQEVEVEEGKGNSKSGIIRIGRRE